ncbi:MAG: DUF1501 domain-containing protein, partial [Planctomycetaceae bacterium]
MNRRGILCDGVQRRDFLRVGGAGVFGSFMTLPGLLQQQTLAAEHGRGIKDERSLIIVFLRGGLSTIDTFDMKPDAPSEFRGDFQPIDTNVAGIQVAVTVGLHRGKRAVCAVGLEGLVHRNGEALQCFVLATAGQHH